MIRDLVKHGFKAMGVELRHYPLFRRAIHTLVRSGPKPFFVQIGANNGIDFDDLFQIVTDYELPGIVVEPLPYYFDALVQVYKRHGTIRPLRAALHPSAESELIYTIDPAMPDAGWQHGLGSFSRAHLLAYGVPPEAIRAEKVPCVSLDTLVREHVPPDATIDILMTDTEGFDGEILRMIDFRRIRPKIIKFESKHLDPGERHAIIARLQAERYVVEVGTEDSVAVMPHLATRSAYLRAALGAGRGRQASAE